MAKNRLSQQDVQEIGRSMKYSKEWFCACKLHDGTVCGARLAIRADKDRDNEKSNFVGVYPPNHPDVRLRGHSIVPSGMLNWNGLAEERGWTVEPEVICPACKEGMTREEFLAERRVAETTGVKFEDHIARVRVERASKKVN